MIYTVEAFLNDGTRIGMTTELFADRAISYADELAQVGNVLMARVIEKVYGTSRRAVIYTVSFLAV